MKEKKVTMNCVVWSKRFQCYGTTLAQKKYMVLVLFIKQPAAWLHCSDICLDPRDPDDGDKKWIRER